jgi:hypothetical protein
MMTVATGPLLLLVAAAIFLECSLKRARQKATSRSIRLGLKSSDPRRLQFWLLRIYRSTRLTTK